MIIIFIECLMIHVAMSLCLCHYRYGHLTLIQCSADVILKTIKDVHLFMMLVSELMRECTTLC